MLAAKNNYCGGYLILAARLLAPFLSLFIWAAIIPPLIFIRSLFLASFISGPTQKQQKKKNNGPERKKRGKKNKANTAAENKTNVGQN